MLIHKEPSMSSNLMCLFAPSPCLALNLSRKRESNRKVPSSSFGISSLIPAVGLRWSSMNDEGLGEPARRSSRFLGQKKVTMALSWTWPIPILAFLTAIIDSISSGDSSSLGIQSALWMKLPVPFHRLSSL